MADVLLQASLRGLVVAAVVWGVVRMAPSLPPATRTWLWWCVSAAFLVALCWTTPLSLAILEPVRPPESRHGGPSVETVGPIEVMPTVGASVASAAGPVQPAAPRVVWRDVVTAAWLAGVLVSGLVAVRRWRATTRLVRTSRPASETVDVVASEIASRLDLVRAPQVRLHPDVDVPAVVGLWRPVVLLPASPRDPSDDALRMSICHELAHVQRRDLLLGCVPALAERLFFFHPFNRVAAREYALAREAACDAIVLQTLGTDAGRYGQWLLELGVTRRPASLPTAGASGSVDMLRRRLIMLERPSRRSRSSHVLAAAVMILIAAATVPLRIVAREVPPVRIGAIGSTPVATPADSQMSIRDVPAREGQIERAVDDRETAVASYAASAPQTPGDVGTTRATGAPAAARLPQLQVPSSALAPCVTTTPVYARAPDDPNASPVTGWWHMSEDKALWVPSPPPGEGTIMLGRYWVRPAGQGVTVRGRRLDGEAPPVLMVEGDGDGYRNSGFFFGGPSIPTEGCWEFDVTSGASRVTFVMEIHLRLEAFIERPQTRVTFENVVGHIESGGTSLTVTAIVVEDPATRTRRLGGARLDLRDGTRAVTLYEWFERLEGTRRTLERAAAGEFPTMVYAIGGTHNIRPAEFLTIRGQEHTFTFASHTHADAARLLVAAGDALRARLP